MRHTTISFLLPQDTPLFHFNCKETHHPFFLTAMRHTTPSFQLPQDTTLFHFNCHADETHHSFISAAMKHTTLLFQLPCRWDTPLFSFQLPWDTQLFHFKCQADETHHSFHFNCHADETHHSQLPLLSNSSDSFHFSHLLLTHLINTCVREETFLVNLSSIT